MNSYRLLWNTVKHLKGTQILFQVLNRVYKPAYKVYSLPYAVDNSRSLKTEPIARYKCLEGNTFSFLNLAHEFAGWGFTDNGMLWAYNQNYFDFINQEGMDCDEGCQWVDRFIHDVLCSEITHDSRPSIRSHTIPLDPYPIALRSINWVKFFCRYPDCATKERLIALYSQLRLLEKKLEYHLLGNHLLEDAYALYIGAVYFGDERLLKKAEKLLLGQLKEQVLPDGAHYEQSVMYHCILLDRLLDCINISTQRADHSSNILRLTSFAVRMLGHLESVVWKIGSFPLLNDAAYGIAPEPEQLFDYARRLGLEWKPIPMAECGYRKMTEGQLEAIVDVGNITATYQPGHTHADTLSYELRVDGKPFIVDTGISTYNKTERRLLERSTIAHNCVSPEGKNSSEVWGGFRVGRRAKTTVESIAYKDESQLKVDSVISSHDGFGKECRRRFEMTENGFVVEDWYDGEAVSYIHLAEGVDEKRICVEGAGKVEIKPWMYSTTYNRFHDGKVMEIHFKGQSRYTIR